MYIHMRARTQAPTHKCMHTRAHTQMHAHACTRTHVHMHARSHARTDARTPANQVQMLLFIVIQQYNLNSFE